MPSAPLAGARIRFRPRARAPGGQAPGTPRQAATAVQFAGTWKTSLPRNDRALPGVTLSDTGDHGERAPTRRYGRSGGCQIRCPIGYRMGIIWLQREGGSRPC
jgi:hypothetical protein